MRINDVFSIVAKCLKAGVLSDCVMSILVIVNWLELDMGKQTDFNRLELIWERAHAKAYSVLIPKDAKKRQQVYQTDR